MEQEQQNENLESPSTKKSLFSFFDTLRVKHIVLLLLCLLFLAILIGGGNNERSPKRLAIKGKKCKTDKRSYDKSAKNKATNSIKNHSIKGENKISKIGSAIESKTNEAIEEANATVKQGKEKIEEVAKDVNYNFKESKKRIGEVFTDKEEKLKISDAVNEKANPKFEKIKPELQIKNNSLAKGLKNTNAKREVVAKTDKTISKLEEEEVKQNNIESKNTNPNSKLIENEINLLKKEVNQLKSRIAELGKSADRRSNIATTKDEDFINERIEFWESVKKNAQNNK